MFDKKNAIHTTKGLVQRLYKARRKGSGELQKLYVNLQ